MSDIEVREREEVMLPALERAGELIDLSDEQAVGDAIDDLNVLLQRVFEVKRVLGAAAAERARVLGVKSFALTGGRKAVIEGGPSKSYDAEAIERELRAAGMPEERIREVVREEVTHTLRVREATRAAGANEEYADIIERNTTEVVKPYSVSIRRK